eukprot:22697-Pelagococcus_subviridis.AAC.5
MFGHSGATTGRSLGSDAIQSAYGAMPMPRPWRNTIGSYGSASTRRRRVFVFSPSSSSEAASASASGSEPSPPRRFVFTSTPRVHSTAPVASSFTARNPAFRNRRAEYARKPAITARSGIGL